MSGKGISGGGAEDACDMVEGIVLGCTNEFEKVFLWAVSPEGGAIGEHRQDDGVIDFPPVGEV